MKLTPTKDIDVELGVVPGVPLADNQLLVNVFGSGSYPLETIHISTYNTTHYQPYCGNYRESVPRLSLTKGISVRICNKCIKAAQLPENQ
jgi:hypothetical protein